MFWNTYLGFEFFENAQLAPLKDYVLVFIVAIVSLNVLLNFLGAYGSMRLLSNFQILWISILASLLTFVSLAAVLFSLKITLSRSFIGIFCGLVALFLTLERFVVLRFLRYWRRKGRNYRNVIICGMGEQAIRLARQIAARSELGIGVRGFSDLRMNVPEGEHERFLKRIEGENAGKNIRILQGEEALEKALKDYAIDEVIFTDIVPVMEQVSEMILLCSEQGVRTTLAADLFSTGLMKSGISYFGEIPLIHYETPPGDGWTLTFKRVLDIVVSAALLIALSWLFLIVSVLIKVTSKGPVFFKQKRVGLNGRFFTIYKFRSMYDGSEKRLKELLDQNEMRGPVFKMTHDPRVTPIGRLLRRFSLDELPQLWNVFRGDMSLVGPRPPVPGEVSMYERRDRRRLSMRPGLTCIWQVSGRNDINDFDAWVRMDLEYIDNWSITRDFVLLIKTIPAVISGTGAR